MKTKIYLRVAKNSSGKPRVTASAKPNYDSLKAHNDKALPTVSFAISLNIPDEVFHKAEQSIAELDIEAKDIKINTEVIPF